MAFFHWAWDKGARTGAQARRALGPLLLTNNAILGKPTHDAISEF